MRWLLTLLPRTIRYMGDGRVPFYYKVLPFLFIPFFFTPVARLLTMVPLLGILDEFTILLLSLLLFTWLSEKAIQRKLKHQHDEETVNTAPSEIIEGDFTVVSQTEKVVRRKETTPANAHEVKHHH